MKLNNQIIILKLLLLLSYLTLSECLFSKYYRKCKLFKEHQGKQISELMEEKVAVYRSEFYIEPLVQTKRPLEYTQLDYFYLEYIGAGGSGEVYLVEDLNTKQAKVLKRYFRERPNEFQQENFIMHRLNYSIEWTKDTLNGIPEKTDYEKDIYEHKYIPTMAIFPSKQSLTLRDVEFFPHEAVVIFYKILLELQKTQKNSIIHHDFKMGNVMVNSLGMNFKMFQTQLIDWNLAAFYFTGYETVSKKGTNCYYSPEVLMRSSHITPATDVWSLAIVMWTFFTNGKPFFMGCKQNNLKAIVTLVGMQKIIELQKKYRLPIADEYYVLLEQHMKNPNKYPPRDIRDAIPKERQQFFNEHLIDVFERMFTPDPEERITVSQLLKHQFFEEIRKIPPMFRQKRRAQKSHTKLREPGHAH